MKGKGVDVAVELTPTLTKERKFDLDNSSTDSDWIPSAGSPSFEEQQLGIFIVTNLVTGSIARVTRLSDQTSTLADLIDLGFVIEQDTFTIDDFLTSEEPFESSGDLLIEEVIPRMPLAVQELSVKFSFEGPGKPRPGVSEIEFED